MPFSFISEGFKFYKNFFYSYTIKTFPVFLLIGISTSAGETFLNDERFFTWGALFFIFTNIEQFLSRIVQCFRSCDSLLIEKNKIKV